MSAVVSKQPAESAKHLRMIASIKECGGKTPVAEHRSARELAGSRWRFDRDFFNGC
jgi:hypothetical protein